MNKIGALVGGVVAGLVGAAVWAGVSYATNYEIGWIAWGIGALVGFGVIYGAREGDTASGLLAVGLSLAAIAGGKYAAVELMAHKGFSEASASMDFTNDTYVTSYLADEEIGKLYAAGVEPAYPAGADPQYPDGPEDYPADVWGKAEARWQAMSPGEREAYRQDQRELAEAHMADARGLFVQEAFTDSFGAMDLLFGALAVFTAFKIGSGSGRDQEQPPAQPTPAGE